MVNSNSGVISNARANILFKTSSGFIYMLQTRGHISPPFAPSFAILVDINGEKKPNMLGKDVFDFELFKNELLPAGNFKNNKDVNQGCSLQVASSGWSCAEKIRRDGWKISKDYPW